MGQPALSSFQMTTHPRTIAERLAAEIAEEAPNAAEDTVSSMAERFAPAGLNGANGVQPVVPPDPIARAGRSIREYRGLITAMFFVALLPAATLAGLLWQGAIRDLDGVAPPADVQTPVKHAPVKHAPVKHASVASAPIAVKLPEIALTAPGSIEAKPGEQVDFTIAIDSDGSLPQRSVIAIRALPKGAGFSQGRPYGATEWTLRPDEIGDLKLKLPASLTDPADLRTELLTADGKVLARATTRLHVAPDPKAGLIVRADESGRIEELMAHGDKMISVGYLAGARAYYKRAAEAGSADAALAVGATYDSAFIAEIGAQGIPSDQEAARSWYARATVLGITDPDAKLEALRIAWARAQGHPPVGESPADAAGPAPPAPAGFKEGAIGRIMEAAGALGSNEEWVETVGTVNIREEASDKAKTLKKAQKGIKFRVVGREGNWVHVTDPVALEEGWIYSSFLKTAEQQ
ncbi:MAG: SH3 domain-containing protein [Methyloceanibacter sp.]